MNVEIDDTTGFDEPADEVTPAPTKAQLAITDDMSRIMTAVGEFDRVSAGLAELEARYPKDVIYEVGTTKGFKAAIEHRAAWRDPRITVEKVRKMAKAPLIALGKNIDARAAWLTEQLLEGEKPIDAQIKAEEARREAEREAKAAAEFGRVLAIQEAMAAIAIDVAAACGKTSEDIGMLLQSMQTTQPDPAIFQEQMEQAKAAWAAGIAKLETAHKAKLWEEAEARRIAAEQEAARIAAQRAAEEMERQRLENERVAAELKAERDRMAAERAEVERQRAEIEAAKAAEAARQQAQAEAAARELEEAERRAKAAATYTPSAEQAALVERGREIVNDILAAEVLGDAIARTANEPLPAPAPEVRAFVAPAANEAPSLKLGELWTALGLDDREAFLASVGFPATPAPKGTGKLYRHSDLNAIRRAIAKRMTEDAEQKKAA